jgi:hypothetical protein
MTLKINRLNLKLIETLPQLIAINILEGIRRYFSTVNVFIIRIVPSGL